jgi:hypothetical protein
MIRKTFGIRVYLILLTLTAAALFVLVGCGSPALQDQPSQAEASQPANLPQVNQPANPPQVNQPSNPPLVNQPANRGEVNVPEESEPTTQPVPAPVEVVVAGYLNHGPMQPTVRAIKEVLDNYGDKVDATWIDLGTKDGVNYFKENNLSAHMNVIINGKYTYDVNGKEVTFQWFEGGQWTSQDLDTVIANLLSG